MGRRKERRLAALSAAGRRVKLDLFAEPTGDLGGSSAQDEVEGDNTKIRAGLPNSPSSSDKQPENPLFLLGQYSDDELDDGLSGEQNQAIAEDSSIIPDDDQEKLDAGRGSEDIGIKEGNDHTAEKVEQLAMENGLALLDSLEELVNGDTGIHAAEADVPHEDNGLTEGTAAASTSDKQVVGDVSSGWKMVLHEESNQYYYWNVATGETSWEVPSALSLVIELKSNAADNEEKETASEVSNAANQNSEITEGNDHKPTAEIFDEANGEDALDDKRWDRDIDQNHQKDSSPPLWVQNLGTAPGANFSSRQSEDVLVGDSNAINVNFVKPGTETDLLSRLMKHCEHLLEKLNIVKGSNGHLQRHDHILKYIVEVEMRLADIKSLACHGSSLLPFWEHSERRLQQLEAVINDVVHELKSELVNEVDPTSVLPESIPDDIKSNPSEEKGVYAAAFDLVAAESAGATELRKSCPEMDNNGSIAVDNGLSNRDATKYSGNAAGVKNETGLGVNHELTPMIILHTGEEIDMDVDMEVEDADTPSNLTISVPPEQLSSPTLTADQGSYAPGEMYNVPPPPDEDWIPPPPPDNEPFPPPPPDEPPEISYPQPSDLVAIQSFPYVEPYNMYPSSHFQYYGQTSADIASSNLYAQTEGCQPAVSQNPLYFEALSDTYGPSTLAVNPIEPGSYYGLQDGMPQPVCVQSSGFHSDSVQNSISDPIGSLDAHTALGSASLPTEVDVPAVGGEAKKATLEPPSSQTPLQASATISGNESVSVSSVRATTASVTTSTTAPKAQSKAPRSKKRTVAVVSSLRSNKKVSSLVDKWKAAKEELQDEEKEHESAYEILEKKRQREIEEWHAQQIASGEAKVNANFQPLGGDWRERVKRKRAKLAKESVQNPSDGVSEGNTQPDLDELSRGLPHGWQAYWDDTSKQVYYGNTSTSETTWIRPTN